MVTYSDNEIQVLGSPVKHSNRKWIWLIPIIVIGSVLLLFCFIHKEETVDIKHFKTELNAPPPRKPEPEMTSGVEYESYLVNDVW